jgi:hypothetical protein
MLEDLHSVWFGLGYHIMFFVAFVLMFWDTTTTLKLYIFTRQLRF